MSEENLEGATGIERVKSMLEDNGINSGDTIKVETGPNQGEIVATFVGIKEQDEEVELRMGAFIGTIKVENVINIQKK